MINVFDQAYNASTLGELIKMENPNDRVQGTFIGTHITTFPGIGINPAVDVTYIDLVNVTVNGVPRPGKCAVKAAAYLKNSLERLNPQKGWVIGIEYNGKIKNKFGTNSDTFTLYGSPTLVDPNVEAHIASADDAATMTQAAPQPAATGYTGYAPQTPPPFVPAPSFAGQPVGAQPVTAASPTMQQPFFTNAEYHSMINALLAGKLGVSDPFQVAVVSTRETGLPYNEGNYEAIYKILSQKHGQ